MLTRLLETPTARDSITIPRCRCSWYWRDELCTALRASQHLTKAGCVCQTRDALAMLAAQTPAGSSSTGIGCGLARVRGQQDIDETAVVDQQRHLGGARVRLRMWSLTWERAPLHRGRSPRRLAIEIGRIVRGHVTLERSRFRLVAVQCRAVPTHRPCKADRPTLWSHRASHLNIDTRSAPF
jgi:hypothetical protein